MSDEAWEKTIGLADMYGTRAEVNYFPPGDDDHGTMMLTLVVGGGTIHSSPTPESARQVAAALLDAADAVEASK